MVAEGNVGLAFGLVFIAAAASMVGVIPVFFTKRTNRKLLAGALGFAAGVMIYVSLTEILGEAIAELQVHECPEDENGEPECADEETAEKRAVQYGTLLFFAGCFIVFVLDMIIKWTGPFAQVPVLAISKSWARMRSRRRGEIVVDNEIAEETIEEGDEENAEATAYEGKTESGFPHSEGNISKISDSEDEEENRKARLKRTSFLVAISLALHNLPEGIAVFVSALADAKLGAAVAIAISVHNIPEGLCIGMPVYYSTGSKLKAVLWTLIPSLAEPFGGLLAYVALSDMSPLAFGIIFGLVAGIMTYVATMELIPAAFKYDPENNIITISVIMGYIVMGISIILLNI